MFKKKTLLLVLLPVLIFILLRFPSIYESYWYGDEGIYAAVSSQVWQGRNLYQQVWDHKPPFIFLLFSVGEIFGWASGLVILKILSIIFGVTTILLINQLLKQKVDNLPRFIGLLFLAFFFGSTVLEGNVVNAEVIFVIFNLLGFYLLIKKKLFGLIGFLAYLSLMTKFPGAVEFGLFLIIFLFVYYQEEGLEFILNKISRLALGFIVPLLATLAYFYFQGALADFLYANIIFNVGYSVTIDNMISLFGAGIPNTLIKIFSLVSILIFTLFIYFKNYLSGFSLLVINLFNAQVFASLLSGKNYGHYFIQVLPGGALLIGLIAQKIIKYFNQKRFDLRQLKFSLIILALFLPTFAVFRNVGKVAYYAPLNHYYWSFFNGYILGDQQAKKDFWWRTGEGVQKTVSFADHLDKNYLEYDQVYIYTDKPWLLALTERNLTNKYVAWFHLEYREEHLIEELDNIYQSNLLVIDNDTHLLEPISLIIDTDFEKISGYQNFNIYTHSYGSND